MVINVIRKIISNSLGEDLVLHIDSKGNLSCDEITLKCIKDDLESFFDCSIISINHNKTLNFYKIIKEINDVYEIDGANINNITL